MKLEPLRFLIGIALEQTKRFCFARLLFGMAAGSPEKSRVQRSDGAA
jgi:hypothetical protein